MAWFMIIALSQLASVREALGSEIGPSEMSFLKAISIRSWKHPRKFWGIRINVYSES